MSQTYTKSGNTESVVRMAANLQRAEASGTLAESVFLKLRADIVEGRYAPGAKLGAERLKAQYGVSTGTLREALSLLVSDGLVLAEAQRGFRVAPMSLAEMEDLTKTRVLLECEALRQSLLHGGDEWEARMVSSFHRLSLVERRGTLDSAVLFDEWEQCNRDFHQTLISACPSVWLQRCLSILYLHMERYRRLTGLSKSSTRNVHAEHLALRDAALARDAERCVALLQEHITLSVLVVHELELL